MIYSALAPTGIKTRYFILQRIEEIRKKENNFDKNTMRWMGFRTGVSERHISEMRMLDRLTDKELVDLFEKILIRCHTQM